MRDETQDNRPAEESTLAGARAADARDTAGAASTGPVDEPAEGVLTLICFTCGTEYYFENDVPPPELACGKCGNKVFRSFFTPIDDEVAQDFEDSTARDLDPDDAEGDATESDIIDLNRP
jgi:hypothetical protein